MLNRFLLPSILGITVLISIAAVVVGSLALSFHLQDKHTVHPNVVAPLPGVIPKHHVTPDSKMDSRYPGTRIPANRVKDPKFRANLGKQFPFGERHGGNNRIWDKETLLKKKEWAKKQKIESKKKINPETKRPAGHRRSETHKQFDRKRPLEPQNGDTTTYHELRQAQAAKIGALGIEFVPDMRLTRDRSNNSLDKAMITKHPRREWTQTRMGQKRVEEGDNERLRIHQTQRMQGPIQGRRPDGSMHSNRTHTMK